jgi:O-antigen/teichoic acid export membrane protein
MSTEQQTVYGAQDIQRATSRQRARSRFCDLFTRYRLGTWSSRAAFSLADQGLVSGTGFATNFLLARWLAPNVYGAFAVVFAGFLFIAGFHNVLLLEPISVLGPARHATGLPQYFRVQLKIHAVLIAPLSVLGILASWALSHLMPENPLATAVLGVSLALPFILLQWLMRRMCYIVQRPAAAVGGSALYFATVVISLLALSRFSHPDPFSAFLIMGLGGLIAACTLLKKLRIFENENESAPGLSWTSSLRDNWLYGRWLVGSTALFSISTQIQTFLLASFLGLGTAGILRAMQIPSLVMTQIVAAAGLLILPVFSYNFSRNSTKKLWAKANVVSLGLGLAGIASAILLWFFARPLELMLFDGKYAANSRLIAVLGLAPVCAAFSIGYSMALRAAQKPHFDLLANVAAAPVGLISAVMLIPRWGLLGAATSIVLASLANALVNFLSARRCVIVRIENADSSGASQKIPAAEANVP